MIDLEMLWRDAKPNTPVCATTGATKNMVLSAITSGARSMEEIENSVPLCGGACAMRNISACGCRENSEAILKIYAPIYDMMTEDGGCERANPKPKPKLAGCPGMRSDKCGGCSGCGNA